ncbi:hypothetical protein OAT67_08525 [Bacteriovoracaceae bacterium]|nr:hypothetical protein [Bacteriovoracaceae bacterium]
MSIQILIVLGLAGISMGYILAQEKKRKKVPVRIKVRSNSDK